MKIYRVSVVKPELLRYEDIIERTKGWGLEFQRLHHFLQVPVIIKLFSAFFQNKTLLVLRTINNIKIA